ncbi:MAG: TetR/AcrR family transcriptional regulator [Faecousia sp.]
MSNKKEYRSSARSRRLIRQAFLELIEEKSVDKITVSDIVNRADLNRSTFYTHYPDVYGIIEELQQEIVERNMGLFSNLEYRSVLNDPMPYLRSIAAMLEENMTLFQKLGRAVQSNHQWDIYRRLMVEDVMHHSDIPPEVLDNPMFLARIHFFLGGILNTFQQWAEGNVNCTLDEICADVAEIIRQTAAQYMETNWMMKP